MQQALKPRKLFIFARPLMQEEYEELEGIIDTSEGHRPFATGDFLMYHRGTYYLLPKEQMEEYQFLLGSKTGWACYTPR